MSEQNDPFKQKQGQTSNPFEAKDPFRAKDPADASGHKGKTAAAGVAGLLGIGLLKAKAFWLVGLKMLTSFKLIYFFKSFLSMFLVIGLYTMTFGWVYAFVVVGLILIHEMGHYIFMRAFNLNPDLPIFVPFLGAYVQMKDMPPDQKTHAWVAIAGPLVGGVTSVGLFLAGHLLNIPLLMAAGNTGVLLNIFQLIPAKPFDGGFIVYAISKWILLPGTGLAFMFGVAFHSPMIIIISLLSAFSTWRAFTRPAEPGGTILGEVPPSLPEKIMIGAAYFGLLCTLGFVYWLSHNQLITLVRPHF